eukprot:1828558-Pyramimonas_sp.AAC.1
MIPSFSIIIWAKPVPRKQRTRVRRLKLFIFTLLPKADAVCTTLPVGGRMQYAFGCDSLPGTLLLIIIVVVFLPGQLLLEVHPIPRFAPWVLRLDGLPQSVLQHVSTTIRSTTSSVKSSLRILRNIVRDVGYPGDTLHPLESYRLAMYWLFQRCFNQLRKARPMIPALTAKKRHLRCSASPLAGQA